MSACLSDSLALPLGVAGVEPWGWTFHPLRGARILQHPKTQLDKFALCGRRALRVSNHCNDGSLAKSGWLVPLTPHPRKKKKGKANKKTTLAQPTNTPKKGCGCLKNGGGGGGGGKMVGVPLVSPKKGKTKNVMLQNGCLLLGLGTPRMSSVFLMASVQDPPQKVWPQHKGQTNIN